MAIDNLENKCLNRKDKSALKYPLNSLLNMEDPKNFNLFQKRSKFFVVTLNRGLLKSLTSFHRVISKRLCSYSKERQR